MAWKALKIRVQSCQSLLANQVSPGVVLFFNKCPKFALNQGKLQVSKAHGEGSFPVRCPSCERFIMTQVQHVCVSFSIPHVVSSASFLVRLVHRRFFFLKNNN